MHFDFKAKAEEDNFRPRLRDFIKKRLIGLDQALCWRLAQ